MFLQVRPSPEERPPPRDPEGASRADGAQDQGAVAVAVVCLCLLFTRLRRIARCIATNQKILPILDLYLYHVLCSVSDTIQYQGGPAGFSL